MASPTKPWQIDFSSFVPRNKFYSPVPNAPQCHVCDDFAEIDEFAKRCTLDKLNLLRSGTKAQLDASPEADLQRNTTAFDARSLFQALLKIRDFQFGFPEKDVPPPAAADISLLDLWKQLAFDNPQFTERRQKKDLEDKMLDKIDADYGKLMLALVEKKAVAKAANNIGNVVILEHEMKALEIHKWTSDQYFTRRGNAVFEEIGTCLWNNFSRLRANVLGAGAAISQTDNVAKARLLYSWITLSVKYDAIVQSKPGPERGHLNVRSGYLLTQRSEVCELYSRSFEWMFNAIRGTNTAELVGKPFARTTIPEPKADYIDGDARGEEVSKKPLPDEKDKHAWAAFPISTALQSEYQLIDPTWGSADARGKPEYLWWSTPARAFSWTHLPKEQGKDHLPIGVYPFGQIARPETAPPKESMSPEERETEKKREIAAWWTPTQPRSVDETKEYLRWIDEDTLNQRSLAATSQNGNLVVTFRNVCPHQIASTKGFYLAATSRGDFLNGLKGSAPTFAEKNYKVPFSINRDNGTWSSLLAEVNIPDAKSWIGIVVCVEEFTGQLGSSNSNSSGAKKPTFVPVIYWEFDKVKK